MKTQLIILLLAISLDQYAQPSEQESALVDLEKKRSEAIAARNMDFLKSLYDDNFYGVTAKGYPVDKKGILDLFGTFKSELSFGPENLSVHLHSGIAVVSGHLVGRTKAGDIGNQSLFMHFYQKKQGKWVLIAGQGASIL